MHKPLKMALLNQPPATPENQISLPSDTDAALNIVDLSEIACTQTTRNQLLSLKRKVDQLWDEGSPKTTPLFLQWRLAVVESGLVLRSTQQKAMAEAGINLEESLATIKKQENALLTEKAILLSQRRTLEEDLSDTISNKTQIENAYFTELRLSLDAASISKDKLSGLKTPRLDRKPFAEIVNEYLETKINDDGSTAGWCNVLGHWLSVDLVKCAHIVPFSWNTKEMAHMFGSDEPPLTSRRNGLSLQKKIEEAFDNCWIVIVPEVTVTSTSSPSISNEWKVVLLNTAKSDEVFFTDSLFNYTSQRLWRWRDIDGRTLSFRNENRPARRFLYLRYALAWLHAEDKGWTGFKEKVPSATIWASPNKPDGYLRKSILLELGKMTGDKLPLDLIQSGIFEDPDTSGIIRDEVAGIRITRNVKDHLDGERDVKEQDEEDEHVFEEDIEEAGEEVE